MERKRPPPVLSPLAASLATSAFWLVCYIIATKPAALLEWMRPRESYNSTLIQGANYFYCGSSIQQAKENNCEYDILNNHWVPSNCMDPFAIREYQADDSWQGYADMEHKQVLSVQEMGEAGMYYTSARDHIVHCAMLWRKQFRALFEGRSHLDSIIVDEEHTMHCSEYLINMTDWGDDFRKLPIEVHVGFAGCHVRQ